MATFRKRPVEVEIRQAEGVEEIETREGTVYANEEDGDLVAEGPRGDVYPIGPRILAQTYAPTDAESMEIYREALPEGVVVEFEENGEAVVASGVYVDPAGLDELERTKAEEFARAFMESSPNLQNGEVVYA